MRLRPVLARRGATRFWTCVAPVPRRHRGATRFRTCVAPVSRRYRGATRFRTCVAPVPQRDQQGLEPRQPQHHSWRPQG